MNNDKKVQAIKIFSHILEILFLWWMLYLWFYLSNIKEFISICIPATAFFGLAQGMGLVLMNIVKENCKNTSKEDN